MKVGDYIEQKNTDSIGLIIEALKNGSFRALVHGRSGQVIQGSIRNWYPDPVVIAKTDVPEKVLNKIQKANERRV